MSSENLEDVRNALRASAELKLKIAEALAGEIASVVSCLSKVLENGGKTMFCGNGGSAADSQHLATELVVRLSSKVNRPPLSALALTTDSSILTACSNDFGFEEIFAHQIRALGRKGDLLFAISTSGNSLNVIKAVEEAKKISVFTVGLLGGDGGKLSTLTDRSLVVPSYDVQRIQESHITIGHIIIELVEKQLFA
jgi:D-sedoheptulose 7-phosphate isomerase